MKHSGAEAAAAVFEPVRGDREALKRDIVHHLVHHVGKDPIYSTTRDWLTATSLAVRDRLIERRLFTKRHYAQLDVKRVYYLSMEFLLGRMLGSALCNMGMYDECVAALRELDVDLDDIEDMEPDAALGNGGLGRLAACILDALATLCLPGHGYGIRYEFGMFRQAIEQGQQVEHPDNWLRYGNPWEFPRPEKIYPVHFYGHVTTHLGPSGEERAYWHAGDEVIAMAYDYPVPGYGGHKNVNNLRLWSAKATRDFDLRYFNEGDYMGALVAKNQSETISKVLYPNDATDMGRELRFKQEYFFVSASLQDIMHRHCIRQGHPVEQLPDKVAIQLNDTHPAIAVAELMRLLVDVQRLPWNKAWEITTATFSYTNHTLMPEALETWPVDLVQRVLPRHMEIIYRINHDFLNQVRHRYPGDVDLVRRLSIIDEDHGRLVRMAHLAVVGSHKVNGVAELHTELLKDRLFRDFSTLWPEKLVNVTNGITPRLWLYQANPGLRRLICEHIGEGWVMDLRELRKIERLAEDAGFRAAFAEVKRENKRRLAEFVARTTGVELSPDALFDVQVKRMHEYKRQILNLLHVITLYDRLRSGEAAHRVPRVVVISGKAAPSYLVAKQLIRLINDVADVINNDPVVGGRLKLVFIPNYEVSVAARIIPAADLSEQISTAGTEASGTGNMKLALNGALTIGTMDGANIEIHDEVGSDNIFIFGLRTDEVKQIQAVGYRPREYYDRQPELRKVLDMIGSGFFSPEEPDRYQALIEHLLERDPYLVLADYAGYVATQELVDELYLDRDTWLRKAILNTARMDKFCIDRTVWDYAQNVWDISPQCYIEESLPLSGPGVEVR
jgi:starch phosphorylase